MSTALSPKALAILILAAFPILTWVACGSADSDPSSAVPEVKPPQVSAAPDVDESLPPAAEAIVTDSPDGAAVAATEAAGAATEAAVAEVPSCLDLVASGAFTEAVPVCVAAASLDPDNAAIQTALAKAQAQSATTTGQAVEVIEVETIDAADDTTLTLPPKP